MGRLTQSSIKFVALVFGLSAALIVGVWLAAIGQTREIAWTAAVVVLCAVWWVLEPVPIPVTSLIPIAVFPLVGVLDPSSVGEAYGHPLVLLMLGGFMLSAGMERSGAHRRIALTMVSLFGGGGGRRLVFGCMAASAILSMWISNAATSLMLLPIVIAIVDKTSDQRLGVALLLGVAYAASIGGTGTPIGTPPNLVFMNEYAKITGSEPTFVDWMRWSLPIALVMIPIAGLWLTRGLTSSESIQLPSVGAWRSPEVRTLAIFAVTALLWITRREPFGGWSEWLNLPSATDASVALLAVVAMFIVPNGEGGKLLDWPTSARIPWGILILYGGGITIAKAFESSGLSASLGRNLSTIDQLPTLCMIGGIAIAVTFLTEVTSNTATANLLMPILSAVAVATEIDPKLIMVPATISASFAFMLPVATPPNAIMFGSGRLSIHTMAREGLVLNLSGAVVVTVICYAMFG